MKEDAACREIIGNWHFAAFETDDGTRFLGVAKLGQEPTNQPLQPGIIKVEYAATAEAVMEDLKHKVFDGS